MNISTGARPRGRSGRRPELVAAAVAAGSAVVCGCASADGPFPVVGTPDRTVPASGRRPCPAAAHSGRESRRRSSTSTTSIRPRKGEDQVNTWGLELAPGLYAAYSSSSVTAAIDYSVIGRAWDDSDYNNVSQQGAANGRWIAVPDLFYIDAQGSITDNVISPLLGSNYGGLGLFGADNLSQQATAGVTPTFDRRFGDFNLLAQYSYGRVWYFDEGDDANQAGLPRAGRLARPERLRLRRQQGVRAQADGRRVLQLAEDGL